ncbi:hypothetical protein [Allosphingosinicella sp.]|uniref:hypothetical protein n=1 Tax=Allosphingosinicella sp. TaxID=2823234 RepID=UPI002FC17F9C
MSEHSIFGDTGGAGRRDRSSREQERKRANPSHGLFGARLLPEDYRSNDRDQDDLPLSRS